MSATQNISNESGKITIVVEGDLETYDSEGGYGPDEVVINGFDMSEIISQFFGVELNHRGSLGHDVKFGKVRLILERSATSDDVQA